MVSKHDRDLGLSVVSKVAKAQLGSALLAWTQPAERVVVDDSLLAIDHLEASVIELDARLTDMAQADPHREPVGWLRCFRAIDTLTGMMILAELHDFRRFHTPRALMAYLGLVPGEDLTGEKHRRGRITRTGNGIGELGMRHGRLSQRAPLTLHVLPTKHCHAVPALTTVQSEQRAAGDPVGIAAACAEALKRLKRVAVGIAPEPDPRPCLRHVLGYM